MVGIPLMLILVLNAEKHFGSLQTVRLQATEPSLTEYPVVELRAAKVGSKIEKLKPLKATSSPIQALVIL